MMNRGLEARMIFLFFRARLRERRWWRFWRRKLADVYGWLALATLDEAMAQARADMGRRGYVIERVHVARDTTGEDLAKRDWSVRMNTRVASRFGRQYVFYPPSPLWDAPVNAAGPDVRSRLLDNPEVAIDPARVPEELRPLLRFGATWAILDDVERSQFIKTAPASDKEALVRAVAPRFEAIEAYSRQHAESAPVPDEVVLLNLLAEAADLASHDVPAGP
jgi:hypothetical protein